jgi:hypothetical protein
MDSLLADTDRAGVRSAATGSAVERPRGSVDGDRRPDAPAAQVDDRLLPTDSPVPGATTSERRAPSPAAATAAEPPSVLSAAGLFDPPGEGGSTSLWATLLGLLTVLTGAVALVLRRRRPDPVPAGPIGTPSAAPLDLGARRSSCTALGAPRGGAHLLDRPVAAAETPSGALAVSVRWIARDAGVHPASLHATAAAVQDRYDRVDRARRETVVEAALETRIAAACAYGMPIAMAGILVVLGGGPTSLLPAGATDGAAVVAAVVLTVGAAWWMRRLPAARPRLLAPVVRAHEQRGWWIEQVRGALDAAELHAATGLGGAAALDAATSGDPSQPLSRLRVRASEGASSERAGSHLLLALEAAEAAEPGDAPAALAWCSEELLAGHDLPLLQRRLTLRRLRMLAPFLLGAVPATLLVVFAASASA